MIVGSRVLELRVIVAMMNSSSSPFRIQFMNKVIGKSEDNLSDKISNNCEIKVSGNNLLYRRLQVFNHRPNP